MYNASVCLVCKVAYLRKAPVSSHGRVARRLRRRRSRPVPRGGIDAHRRAVGGVVSHRRARRIPRAFSSRARRASSFPAKYFPRGSSFPRQGCHRSSHLLCLLLRRICFASPPPLSPCRRVILAGVGCGVMSTAGSARRNNGLTTSAFGATARIPSQTLGRGFRVVAAATAGRGGGCGVGLPPRRAPVTTLPTRTPFTMDGFRGGVPS
jgi:hypothetical protein